MKTILKGPPGFSDNVTFWTKQRDSIRIDNAADIIPTIKVCQTFSDLRDKSLDVAETYLKLGLLSLGFCRVFGISDKGTV